MKRTIITLITILSLPVFAEVITVSETKELSNNQDASCTALFKSTQLQKAIAPCSVLATAGNSEAAEMLARIYSTKGAMNDSAKAFEWASIASEQGRANAQAMLGLMYLRGEGTQQNHQKAQHFIQLAIDNGNKGAIELRRLMKRAGIWQNPV